MKVFVFYFRMYHSVWSVCVCLSACTAQRVPVSNSITVLGSSVAGNPHTSSSVIIIIIIIIIVIITIMSTGANM